MARFQFHSVRSRLLLLFAVSAIIPLIVVNVIIYHQRAEDIKRREFAKLTAIRDLKVDQVKGWIYERTGDIRTIASNVDFRTAADTINGARTTDIKQLSRARQLLNRYVQNYNNSFLEIFMVDAATGKIKVSSNSRDEGMDRSDNEYFTETLRTRNIYIKDVYFSKTLNTPAMTFSHPVFSLTDESRVSAVVVARINLKRSLYDILLHRTGLGRTGETLIVNKNVMALNELRWYANAPLNLHIKAEPAVRASKGGDGIVETTDYRGERILAAYTHIPRTDWGFVAKQDLSEIYAPISSMLTNMIIIFLIFSAAIFIIAVFTARSFAKPVIEMTEVSKRLREGDLTARLSIKRADEFGIMGNVFNSMTDSMTAQMKIQEQVSALTRIMVEAETLTDFSSGILQKLLEVTNSNFGVFYILGPEKHQYTCLDSLGAQPHLLEPFDAVISEGEIGAAIASGDIVHIKDIPGDTKFHFKAFIGDTLPKEIVTIPLTSAEGTPAILSIASLHHYSEVNMEMLRLIRIILSTAFSNLTAVEKTKLMSEDLKFKNEEITAVNEELHAQTEELHQRTIELRAQAEQLDEQRTRVQEADRLKTEFLSNVSHELRTPLNSILSLSQLMLSKGTGADPEKEREFLEVIERNGRLLLNLINNILDLSRIESGRMEVFGSFFEPRFPGRNAMDTVRPLAESKGLALEGFFENAPKMFSDEDKVGQILLNLLSNAVKFTKEGHVHLKVATAKEDIIFRVEDTGIGISREDLGHVFDEFRQVDGSTTREFEGTGLGLTISQKYARLLGGAITAQSQPGIGSVFSLRLPVQYKEYTNPAPKPGPPLAAPPKIRPIPAPDAAGRHILVVEDNAIVSMQISAVLEEKGYYVSTAKDGAEGLEQVETNIPDAIILDIMMPRVDGFTVLDRLHSTPGALDIPILVLTAKEMTREEYSRLKRSNVRQLVRKGSLDRKQLGEAVECLFFEEHTPLFRPEFGTLGKGESEPQYKTNYEPVTEKQAPLSTESSAPPTSNTAPDSETTPGAKTILVVEDNPDNLFTVTTLLETAGYRHISASDGEFAVLSALENHPDLILMDIQLPLLSGLDATKQIRRQESRHTPIIALTAKAMKGDREIALNAGCDDYISKPIETSLLLKAIEKWLPRSGTKV
ncbi:MAG: response regulator [bacterium]|nr:response regulator [bacterium]